MVNGQHPAQESHPILHTQQPKVLVIFLRLRLNGPGLNANPIIDHQ